MLPTTTYGKRFLTNGAAKGLIPMLRVFNDTAVYADQGGKRNGSFAIYIEPWHADVLDFLKLKRNNTAGDKSARDLLKSPVPGHHAGPSTRNLAMLGFQIHKRRIGC